MLLEIVLLQSSYLSSNLKPRFGLSAGTLTAGIAVGQLGDSPLRSIKDEALFPDHDYKTRTMRGTISQDKRKKPQ